MKATPPIESTTNSAEVNDLKGALQSDNPQHGVLTAEHLRDDDADADGGKAEADCADYPSQARPVAEDHGIPLH
jgi:hypothetical protein